MRDWFADHTHAKAEFVAKANLERQGFGTYLPVLRKTRRHARRTEVVSAPLFPRYIFVCLGRGTGGWTKIRYSRGVSNIVSFGFISIKLLLSPVFTKSSKSIINLNCPSSGISR